MSMICDTAKYYGVNCIGCSMRNDGSSDDGGVIVTL